MRIPVIAGNWKLFKRTADALDLVTGLSSMVKDVDDVQIIVAPSFTVLPAVHGALAGTRIFMAGQDCFWSEEGAFTGEVSPGMLIDSGCSHVIIGHSERRQYFGETDETVNKKIKAALKAGLVPIVCIGETLLEREAGETLSVLERQLRSGFDGIPEADAERLIIAYEPVWAIGTGKTASDEQAQEVHAYVRALLARMYQPGLAERMRILYGGSVKPDNIKGLMSCPDIDGALVGGASLSAESFSAIVKYGK